MVGVGGAGEAGTGGGGFSKGDRHSEAGEPLAPLRGRGLVTGLQVATLRLIHDGFLGFAGVSACPLAGIGWRERLQGNGLKVRRGLGCVSNWLGLRAGAGG